VDRTAEEAAQAAHEAAERRRAGAEARLAAVRASLDAARAEAAGDPLDDLAIAHAAAEAEAADEPAARQALAAAERAHAELLERRQRAERDAAAHASRRETLLAERAALREEIEAAREGAATVAERAAELTGLAEALAAASAAVRAAEESADRLKQADAALADAAYRAGFDTPQAAADAALDATAQAELARRVQAAQAEEAAVATLLAETEVSSPPGELREEDETSAETVEAAEAVLDAATGRLRATSATESSARARRADLDALSARATADATALQPLRAEARRLSRLAGLASGTSPENAYRMRLETYVLAARLEQVVAAANARLHRMAAARYTLVHSDAKAAQGARSGLGLRVVDAWTGRDRDTATLSGGESFIVSLALALGLADVVAQEAGGARLDTLFVDEGFGSLDEDSLDEVLNVLDALREHDRSVAIVSHVPDLRARIPTQLEITKTRRGSAIRHHVRA
jgi:exonuclease SbcC